MDMFRLLAFVAREAPLHVKWDTDAGHTTRGAVFVASLVDPSQCDTWCHTGDEAPTLSGLSDDDPRWFRLIVDMDGLCHLQQKKKKETNIGGGKNANLSLSVQDRPPPSPHPPPLPPPTHPPGPSPPLPPNWDDPTLPVPSSFIRSGSAQCPRRHARTYAAKRASHGVLSLFVHRVPTRARGPCAQC